MFDVQKILEEKNPSLAQKIPSWGFYLLRTLVHEPLIGAFLSTHDKKDALDFTLTALKRMNITLEIRGLEHLTSASRPIVCANHPTGGLEGLGLISILCKELGNCRIPANDILGTVQPLQPLLVPLDKKRPTRESLDALEKVFQGDEPILIFPAGVTARKKDGKLREFPWQTSFITHGRRSGRDLVPVWVSGENSWIFYGIHRIRTALSIRFNIEMALLADELIKKRNSRLIIQFLPPISPSSVELSGLSPRAKDSLLTQQIQRQVETYSGRLYD